MCLREKTSVNLLLCLYSPDTMSRTNGDNSAHFQESLHEDIHGVIHTKSDQSSCVRNEKSLKEKHKLCLPLHLHTADTKLNKESTFVRLSVSESLKTKKDHTRCIVVLCRLVIMLQQ